MRAKWYSKNDIRQYSSFLFILRDAGKMVRVKVIRIIKTSGVPCSVAAFVYHFFVVYCHFLYVLLTGDVGDSDDGGQARDLPH